MTEKLTIEAIYACAGLEACLFQGIEERMERDGGLRIKRFWEPMNIPEIEKYATLEGEDLWFFPNLSEEEYLALEKQDRLEQEVLQKLNKELNAKRAASGEPELESQTPAPPLAERRKFLEEEAKRFA